MGLTPFDEAGEFRPATDGLRRMAVRGAAGTLLSSGMGLAIQMIATVVLARLLVPRDFGLVTMVTTFSLLLVNFGGNGLTEAILQREDLNHSLASNLFWINLGSGVVLTGVFASAGSLLAWFFHEPLVARIAVGISLGIVITSTSVLHLALLMRAMRFPLVNANDVAARIASVSVSILLARAGWGYWALVAGTVSQSLSQAAGAWILCRWVPSLPRRVAGTGAMMKFAIHVYGRFSMNYFARNMDNLLVGWRFSAQSLGFYKKAYDLFALSVVMQSLTSVAVSALSRLRGDSQQYRRYLLRALSLAAFLGMGLGGCLTLVGTDVIGVLLGPGWEEAGRIFTFFGPGIGAMFLYGPHGWIHLSIGRGDRWLRWGVFEFIVTGLLFLLMLPWGPVGIATAWSLSLWILMFPSLWYAGRPINLELAPMVAAVWRYVPAAVFSASASALAMRSLHVFFAGSGPVDALMRIAIASLLFSVLYLAAVVVLYRGFSPLYQLTALLREVLPSRWLSKASPVGDGAGTSL